MRFFTLQSPMLDAAGDGGAGGGSTDAGATGQQQTGQTGQSSTQSSQSATQTQAQSGQQAAQTGTGPTSGTTAQPLDPKDFIPRHRYNEVSGRLRAIEEANQDLQRRLTIALGGQPVDPQTQKAQSIVDAFFNLPGMGKLRRFIDMEDDQLEALLETPRHIGAQQKAEEQHWQRHGNQQTDTVSAKVAEAIGVDSLDDEQRGDLRVALRTFVQSRSMSELQQAADRYGAEAVQQDERRFSPTLRRYEDGDPKLLDEFVTRYTKNWVEPARRTATARTSTRTRAVPETSGRAAVSSIQRPTSFKNWDERLEYAAKVAKERGLTFDR